MTRSIFALLLLAACTTGNTPPGETGLDVNNVDDSDTIDTDRPDTDVNGDTDDTAVAVDDTAFESDTDLEDTDAGDTDSGVVVDPDFDLDGYPASTDCDDTDSAVHPNAQETCNQKDDDCDTLTDEGTNDGLTYHRDLDGDTYGSPSFTTRGCGAPAGYVLDGTDCNDSVQTTHPGADETCNSVDDNCFGGVDEDPVDGNTYYLDNDNDNFGDPSLSVVACLAPRGYADLGTDCDDTIAAVHPGATEVCNLRDDNCVNGVDEGVKSTFYLDGDFDNYGDQSNSTQACTVPAGYVADKTDCNDAVDTTHPGATELCNGVDDNCVAGVDEGVKITFYADADHDTYGNAAVHQLGCVAPFGYVRDNTDCNDTVDFIHPDAPETNCTDPVDYNCDGSTGYADADSDGVPACEDCDDHAVAVFPGATESCNGVDDDCDTVIDEGLTTVFYADADADTYGDAGSSTSACTLPAGYATNATDCDDTRSAVNPGATEVCNLRDDNCTNGIDEGVKLTFHPDADSDFYGSLTGAVQACAQPQGYVSDSTDCNDNVSTVHPFATEVCNGVDDNCTNGIDEGVKTTFYADVDADTYGDATSTASACTVPNGYVATGTDCDDTRAIVHPGAAEVCDGLDNNCVNGVDEGVKLSFYADVDGDNYGDAASPGEACTLPEGSSLDGTDCDDTVFTTHPNALEACNGTDDDCDTLIDEGVKTTFYADTDHDTYGNTIFTVEACTAPPNYVLDHTDCDDSVATIHPNATETCNGADDDCDTLVDEGVKTTFYADNDHDNYGAPTLSQQACSAPANYVTDNTDCNDAVATVHPNATETCNGVDDDCSLTVDDHITNVPAANKQAGVCVGAKKVCDGVNGFVEPNYASIAFYEATEVSCDTKDNDCDSSVDEGVKTTFYADTDADTYGDASSSQQACSKPANTVTDHTDCDDTRAFVHPGAPEVCDGLDNNCNTTIDENATDATNYYADADGDGYGDGTATASCSVVEGQVTTNGDCDDSDNRVYPGAYELCDGQQNDCDAVAWTGTDEDGIVSVEDIDGNWYDDTTFFTGVYDLPEGTVHICKGTYDVELVPNPVGVTVVQGEGAAVDIILSGALTHRVVNATRGDVRLSTLTVDGGYSEGQGGCVYVDDAKVTVTGSVITNCAATGSGGAFYVGPNGILSLDSTDVTWSTSAGGSGGMDGGGGAIASSGSATVANCTLSDNYAQDGRGGAVHVASGSIVLDNVLFSGNGASVGGGMVLLNNAGATVDGVTMTGNVAAVTGGGIYSSTTTEYTIRGGNFDGNTTLGDGGGLTFEGGTIHLTSVTVVNGGAEVHGGGIAAYQADLTLTECSVKGNSSGSVGGGVWANYSTFSALDSSFDSNTVRADGGRGGGLYLDHATTTLTGGSVSFNQSLDKLGNMNLASLGGGLYVIDSAVRLAYAAVDSNLAGAGGAVWMHNNDGGIQLELAGTTAVTNNYAFLGGAVFVDAGMARCGTTPDDAASITTNTSDDPNTGAGVFLHGVLADFNFLQCDMGLSGGPADNVSGGYVNQDVTTDVGTFGYGVSATDTCNGAFGCGPT